MDNPYEGVDWESVEYLHSVNHMHTFSGNPGEDYWERGESNQDGQATFESMYDRGIRHFALSNYHPSKPTYPLEDYFEDVPADALGCPNGEHSASGIRGHYTTVGSDFESYSGYDGSWQDLYREALDALRYDGGGGIVINHPSRTGLSIEQLGERLDFDERVLGIEAYNHRCETKYYGTGDALAIWDELLLTGREVYGYFNPDYHSTWTANRWATETWGRNVLLVPEATEDAAARAYRSGHTVGAFRGSGLMFERIDASEDEFHVATNEDARVEFISDRNVVQTTFGTAASYEVRGDETYVRVEASDDSGERIFSQPVLYRFGERAGTERFTRDAFE